MKQVIQIARDRECFSLIPDIHFATVPAWFGATKRDLKMDIIAPKFCRGHDRLPAIVWICGGSFYAMDKAVWIPQLIFLAEKGYVVCSVEYRTSNEASFPAPLEDIKSAIRFLRAHGTEYAIDPEKIVVMGESAGGTLAALTGVTGNCREFDKGEYLDYPSSVQAIVDFYGIADLELLSEQMQSTLNQMDTPWVLEAFLGARYSPETARKASAVSYVAPGLPPVLILHGDQDTMVPVEQSELFHAALERAGVPTSFYLVKNAVHGDDCFYQDAVLEKIDRTLKQWLAEARRQ